MYCKNCGTNLSESSTFCSNCGKPVRENNNVQYQQSQSTQPVQAEWAVQARTQTNNATYQQYQQAQQSQQSPQPQQYNPNTQPYQQAIPSAEQADAKDNKAMGVLSYFGLLVLIPIFAAKDSKFARFHSNQGLVLLIFNVAYSVLVGIINSVFASVVSWSMLGVYTAVSTILSLSCLFFAVLAIIGIVNACKGEMKGLPLIGKIKILKTK